jgi:MFS family permease
VVSGYQMTGDLGMVIGPLLGGWLLDASGGYTWPFGLSLAFAIVLAALVVRTPETSTRHYARTDA